MNEIVPLKSLRDRPFELLAELERRGRAVTAAAASENPGAREWVGVAFRMAGELYLAAREETRERARADGWPERHRRRRGQLP